MKIQHGLQRYLVMLFAVLGLLTFLPACGIPFSPHGRFELGPSLNIPRARHSATLLQDGRVLIAGGFSLGHPENHARGDVLEAEIYDPKTKRFTLIDKLFGPIQAKTSILLPDGRVAFIGKQTQIFDPKTEKFMLAGKMLQPRGSNTATLLKTGQILVTGGGIGGPRDEITNSAELYDPSTESFSWTGSMNYRRFLHTAILLKDDRVLILGGSEGPGQCINKPEIYDPSTEKFTLSKATMACRLNYTPVLLPDGNILIHGGNNAVQGHVFESLPDEIYLPQEDKFITVGKVRPLIGAATVSVLKNGKILFTGGNNMGFGEAAVLQTSEIYDPQRGIYEAGPSMNRKRGGFAQTVLNNASVLITGGSLNSRVIDASEIWEGK